jgi:hypothetical protein
VRTQTDITIYEAGNRLYQAPNLLVPWSWTSSLQYCKQLTSVVWNLPICDSLSRQLNPQRSSPCSFSLHSWNRPFLQVLISFSRKWYLEPKTRALDVLSATEMGTFSYNMHQILSKVQS